MQVSRKASKGLLGVVAAAAALAVVPALAARPAATKAPLLSLTFDRIAAFTPSEGDPRLARAFAGRPADFKFTPAAARSRPSQIRVAVRARVDQPVETATAASPLTPASYNLGVAVGWRRFAVTGDVAKVKGGNPALGTTESAVVGVNYNLKRFTGRVALGGERIDPGQAAALARGDSYQVDLGGAYNITRNIAVTGGVRYKVEQERLSTLADQRADSKAVYVGTAFKF